MKYDNIPAELKELPQWVCVDMTLGLDGQPKKEPINPHTFGRASVTAPHTWGTFEQVAALQPPALGFVFTSTDPYTLIDLDDHPNDPATDADKERFGKIIAAFNSYCEVSPSGRGVHIIVKGEVPEGRDRDHVGIYSTGRYGIMTGHVVRDVPIEDRQALLTLLWEEANRSALLKGEVNDLPDRPAVATDEQVIQIALTASNADKVAGLCRGEWQGVYQSQSHADFALLSILCFYSPNNDQVKRIFRMTNLGLRTKATRNDKYLDRSVKNIRLSQPPPVDASKLVLAKPHTPAGEAPTPLIVADPPYKYKPTSFTFPPGVIGEVAEFILGQAIRPVPEIALAGAIAFTAGIIGRSYNISGTGLNQYIAVIALTGTGKEAAADGINKIFLQVRQHVPSIEQFIGPGVFSSGQAVLRTLDKKPCFVSVLGEFGHTLGAWSDPRQPEAVRRIKQVLLDCYNKSGKGQLLYPAAYSDSDKDTKLVQAPCISVLGEATPESFFDNLSITQMAEGLIPRFSIIEYDGERPERNTARVMEMKPELIKRLADMASTALYTMQNNSVVDVPIDQYADALFTQFDKTCDNHIRGKADAERQIWNRGHVKALKLAGLVAAATTPHKPLVTLGIAQWAIEFVEREVNCVASRFANLMYGSSEGRFESYVRQAIDDYDDMPVNLRIATYKVPAQLADKDLIPFCYLRRRLKRLAAFSNDRRGSMLAIKLTLQDLVEAGMLQPVPALTALTVYGTNSPVYQRGQSW